MLRLEVERAYDAANAHRFDQAEEILKRVAGLDPGNGEYAKVSAEFYEREGNDLQAYRALHHLMHDFAPPSDSDQSDPRFLVKYGLLCDREGDQTEAIGVYRRAVHSPLDSMGFARFLELDADAGHVTLKSVALLSAALTYHAHGEVYDALYLDGLAIKQAPDWALARAVEGVEDALMGQSNLARQNLQIGLRSQDDKLRSVVKGYLRRLPQFRHEVLHITSNTDGTATEVRTRN